jgi:molybdopterin molybdotransferase
MFCHRVDGPVPIRHINAILRSMSEANCFVVLGHEQGSVKAGDPVDVMLMEGLV